MQCPTCQSDIEGDAEACFHCGMALFALTRGTVLSGRTAAEMAASCPDRSEVALYGPPGLIA